MSSARCDNDNVTRKFHSTLPAWWPENSCQVCPALKKDKVSFHWHIICISAGRILWRGIFPICAGEVDVWGWCYYFDVISRSWLGSRRWELQPKLYSSSLMCVSFQALIGHLYNVISISISVSQCQTCNLANDNINPLLRLNFVW